MPHRRTPCSESSGPTAAYVAQGDLVIMFTDGMRDNLHDREALGIPGSVAGVSKIVQTYWFDLQI